MAVSVPAMPSATCKLVAEISDIQEISQPYPSLLLKLKVKSFMSTKSNKSIPSKEGIKSSFTIYVMKDFMTISSRMLVFLKECTMTWRKAA